ncbi:uncharacterized protein [Temnothorax nylanderi]|uniref:uncharacterized protein n=1 Tax=Temnothorax nylanderi TaxID=102681 RepID=UPI003A88D9D2
MDSGEYIRICHVNCQSLFAHLDEFRAHFVDSEYHIICMSETWLKPNIPDRMVSLQGYNVFRRDIIGKTGRGVAFYLRGNAHARILRQSEENYCRKPEYLMAEISMDGNFKILLAVVYRPPHCGYIEEFFNAFSELSALYRHTVVFGDFNADLNTRTFDAEQIRSLVDAMHFHLVPYEPTHHTRTSSTWLDLCIIDDYDKLVAHGQQEACYLSAHDLVDITYKVKVERFQRRHIIARDFRSFNSETFWNELAEYDWSSVFTAEDIDSKLRILNDYLLKCFDKHAPLRNVYPRHLPAPWLTNDIKSKMKERNMARRKWKRCRNDTNYDNYKHLRNQVQSLAQTSRINQKQSSEMKLLFSTEELVDFFTYGTAGTNRDAQNTTAFYLGEESYDDSKFYLGNIEPGEVLKAITRIRSDAALEHILAEQIKVYLDDHDLLDPHQSAYRKDHSTQTALIRILDDVRQAADARKVTIAIFFDFYKAFDSVDHYVLIEKLRNLGFTCSALRWLCSYLCDRSKVLRHCKYNFYADDLCIYLHTELKYLAEAVQKANQDISNIVPWATENRLSLNPSKTTAMIMGTVRYINGLPLDDLPHIVVDTIISYKESVVYLG